MLGPELLYMELKSLTLLRASLTDDQLKRFMDSHKTKRYGLKTKPPLLEILLDTNDNDMLLDARSKGFVDL